MVSVDIKSILIETFYCDIMINTHVIAFYIYNFLLRYYVINIDL